MGMDLGGWVWEVTWSPRQLQGFWPKRRGGCGWQGEEQVGAPPLNLALSKCLQAPRSSSILTSELFYYPILEKRCQELEVRQHTPNGPAGPGLPSRYSSAILRVYVPLLAPLLLFI